MLIPLGTDRPLRRPTMVTPVLIGINIAIYLGQAILQQTDPEAYMRLLTRLWVSRTDFHAWTLVSSAFLHGGWLHLLANMVFLWVFGPNVEDRFRRWGFLIFYLLAGAASGGAHALFDRSPAIGASGAIAGVTGAYIVLFPHTFIKCLLFFFIIGIYQIPAWVFVLFAVARDFVFAGADDGVARMAHLGGYAFGLVVSLLLLATRLLRREPYDLFSIGRQAYRRRQLKDLGYSKDRDGDRAAVRRNAGSPVDSPAAKARAEVATLLANHDLDRAAAAYKGLVEAHADAPSMCTLAKRQQLDLANHLFASADHAAAAYAYDRFLEAYDKDQEAPRVRLILALINERYLNDPIRARQLLTGLEALLTDDEQKTLARSLLTDLG